MDGLGRTQCWALKLDKLVSYLEGRIASLCNYTHFLGAYTITGLDQWTGPLTPTFFLFFVN